jgi:hypothetical protein
LDRRADRFVFARNPTAEAASIKCILALTLGRDQEHVRDHSTAVGLTPPRGQREATLSGEVDVDQHDLRPELTDLADRVSPARGAADHRDLLPCQQSPPFIAEAGVVVDDQAGQSHTKRTSPGTARRRIDGSLQLHGSSETSG